MRSAVNQIDPFSKANSPQSCLVSSESTTLSTEFGIRTQKLLAMLNDRKAVQTRFGLGSSRSARGRQTSPASTWTVDNFPTIDHTPQPPNLGSCESWILPPKPNTKVDCAGPGPSTFAPSNFCTHHEGWVEAASCTPSGAGCTHP